MVGKRKPLVKTFFFPSEVISVMPPSGHTWLLQSLLPETQHLIYMAHHTKSALCKRPGQTSPNSLQTAHHLPLPHDSKTGKPHSLTEVKSEAHDTRSGM